MQVSVELKLKSEGHDDDIAQVTVQEAAAKLGTSERGWGCLSQTAECEAH